MIEAVNSVLSNASVTRIAAEQQSTSKSLTANPDKIQEVAKTPYVSPYISIDRQSNRAILQIRDSDTGDVVRQFPTEGQLKAYQSAQKTSVQPEETRANEAQDRELRVSEQPTEIRESAPQQQAPVPSVKTEA